MIPETISFTIPLAVWVGALVLAFAAGLAFRIRQAMNEPGYICYTIPEGVPEQDASKVTLGNKEYSILGIRVWRGKDIKGPKGVKIASGKFVSINFERGKEPVVHIF